ncbi:MAG: MarR family winged helix-turn-helix transcriptional regulator [Bacteroidota bacterium]
MESIIDLLTKFKHFGDQTHSMDHREFARWLLRDSNEPIEQQAEGEVRLEKALIPASIDVQVSYFLARLSSFLDAWVKLSYRDVPLVSIADFSILKTVEELKNPTKKDILARVIIEPSTGIESIKRLTKRGIFKEYNDQEDRRLKRVQLTAKGSDLCATMNRKMTNLGHFLLSALDEQEKRALFPILNKLNNFHQELYDLEDRTDIKKTYNL